jgi:hypothetical protein
MIGDRLFITDFKIDGAFNARIVKRGTIYHDGVGKRIAVAVNFFIQIVVCLKGFVFHRQHRGGIYFPYKGLVEYLRLPQQTGKRNGAVSQPGPDIIYPVSVGKVIHGAAHKQQYHKNDQRE